jgi:hypothetical protein
MLQVALDSFDDMMVCQAL